MSNPFYTTGDLCARYGITSRTLYNWRQQKGFPAPCIKAVGGFDRYAVEAVDGWEQQVKAA